VSVEGDGSDERDRLLAEALFGAPASRVRARAALAADAGDARELRRLERALRRAGDGLRASSGPSPEREQVFVERVLTATTRAPHRRLARALRIAAAVLLLGAGAVLWTLQRERGEPRALGIDVASHAPADSGSTPLVAAAPPVAAFADVLAAARSQLAERAQGAAGAAAPERLSADAPLELKLLEARARGLRERRWDGWLRELSLADLSPMAQALWLDVELDRFVLTGSRPPGWGQALAILERNTQGEPADEGARLLERALGRARAYGLADGSVLVARADPAELFAPQWFDDLAVAGREAGLGDARILRAWVDWRGN